MKNDKKHMILIVDDEIINSTLLDNILNTEYDTRIVNSGADALDFVKKHKPDIILLDIVMPGMDGLEVLTALKGNETTRDIPVIIITGVNDTEYEEKGLTIGAGDYITKPYSPIIVKLRLKNQLDYQALKNKIAELIK